MKYIILITLIIFYFFYKKYRKPKFKKRRIVKNYKPQQKTINKQQANRIKSHGLNKELLERLIEFELERKPNLSREKAIDWALDRLERDNR